MPHGHVGLVGWRLTSGGVQIIPSNLGAWVVADGEADTWHLDGYHDSGKWEVQGYNLGNQPHSVRLHFHLSPIRARLAVPRLLTPAELAEVPDLSRAGPPPGRP